MNDTGRSKLSIGAEIPYRRDQIEKPTGSLVFDQHLKETLSGTTTAPQEQSEPTGRDQVT
jgi:hypothetical protein